MFVKITYFNPPLIIGVVYRPPNAPGFILEYLNDYVDQFAQKCKCFILAGDFNLPLIEWESLCGIGQCSSQLAALN